MSSFSLLGLLRGGGGEAEGWGSAGQERGPGDFAPLEGREKGERERGREGEVETTTSFAFHF